MAAAAKTTRTRYQHFYFYISRVLLSVAVIFVVEHGRSSGGVSGQAVESDGCVTPGAVYNRSINTCVCQDGYIGVGDISCVRDDGDYDVCWLTGDPYLRSVNDERVALNIPCTVCINVMRGQTQDGKQCLWEVLAASTIGEQGAMYSSLVKIAMSIDRKAPVYFSFDGNSVSDPVADTAYILDANGEASTTVQGETINLSYDDQSGLWAIEGCEHKLLYRPKKDGVDNGKLGILMQGNKGSTVMSAPQGNLCNLDSSFPTTDAPRGVGVMNSAFNVRQIFTRTQAASVPEYDDTCTKLDGLIENECQGISQEAMSKCGPLLQWSTVRYCLDADGVRGPVLAALFHQCMQAFCVGGSGLCDDFKSNSAINTCIPSLTDCTEWPYY